MQVEATTFSPSLIGYDSSFDRIEQVLALSFWLGLKVRERLLPWTCTVSRNDLHTAAFCDLLAQFYFPGRNLEQDLLSGENIVGMSTEGPAAGHPPRMIQGVLNKRSASGSPVYARHVATVNDTAEAVVLLRNRLAVGTGRIVLAGPPVNLLRLLAADEAAELTGKQVETLVIAGGRFKPGPPDPLMARHAAAFNELLSRWPGSIVFAGAETGENRYPASSIEKDYAWAPNHPVADAYRAFARMPYDAPSHPLAAVLHAAEPDAKHFQLSEPGTASFAPDGAARFAPSTAGKHRFLIGDPSKSASVLDVYRKTISAPVGSPSSNERGSARPTLSLLIAVIAGTLLFHAPQPGAGQDANFDSAVKPALANCAQCHNARSATGGLDVTRLNTAGSILSQRQTWEKMADRVRSGEMPPRGAPRPPREQLEAMTGFVESYLSRHDSQAAPDPGRVVGHRLNRTEYENTVRDLLGVTFRADRFFPADDSGGGFDNIADLLSVSPLMTERYFAAAELLANWAISTEQPPAPITIEASRAYNTVEFVDRSMAEMHLRFDYPGDYEITIVMIGARLDKPDPLTLGVWLNGSMIHTSVVQTAKFNPDDVFERLDIRAFIPAGDHTLRAGFIDDQHSKTIKIDDLFYGDARNKIVGSLIFKGPYPSKSVSENRKMLLICDPASGRACIERIVGTIARRAYRRKVHAAELGGLMRLVDMATERGLGAEQGIQAAIQAILVSPSFLFRTEADPPADGKAYPISGFELASRLSYFLWSSMPDDRLLDQAESGRLRSPAVLRAEVDRMLADPKSSRFAANFAGQWLETRAVLSIAPDGNKFPEWFRDVAVSMRTETELFFRHVLTGNRSISDFLAADYTFLNENLADHYGIPGVRGTEFRRVDLKDTPAGAQRGGVLTQGAVLAVTSYPNRTSPVLRGKFVLDNILGTPPPPPPPSVPKLDEASAGAVMSLRQQLEQHRRNPECASCHSRMDPLGFGLENYDAIGRWRVKDGDFTVDASGTLPDGKTFSSQAELRSILLAQLPQFSRNLSEKMLTYALRRGLEPHDRPALNRIQEQVRSGNYGLKTMVYGIVESLPFQFRRGDKPVEQSQ